MRDEVAGELCLKSSLHASGIRPREREIVTGGRWYWFDLRNSERGSGR